MGKYQRFDEIPVWQEAARLYQRVLDVVEQPNVPLSATFRTQLERASLCVSNNVAEGFERLSTSDLVVLLTSARGAAAEVQSMIGVVSDRPKVAPVREPLQLIRTSAEACARAIENPGQKRGQAEPVAGASPQSFGAQRSSASNRPGA